MSERQRWGIYALLLILAVCVGAATGSVVYGLESEGSDGDDDLAGLAVMVYAAGAALIGLVLVVVIELIYQLKRWQGPR